MEEFLDLWRASHILPTIGTHEQSGHSALFGQERGIDRDTSTALRQQAGRKANGLTSDVIVEMVQHPNMRTTSARLGKSDNSESSPTLPTNTDESHVVGAVAT